MHTHGSLSKNGENVFFDPSTEDQTSEIMHYYIGGLMKHAKALARLGNPTINSYKRLVPGFEAPVYITWSTANRSVLIRVPSARGNSTRAELRSPDPMCNPYLLFAGMLAPGLDGIRNKILPPPPTDVNIYELSEEEKKRRGIEMLPGSLIEANDELLKDKVICDALGPHIVDNLTKIVVAENDEFRQAVHPWEVERYINNF